MCRHLSLLLALLFCSAAHATDDLGSNALNNNDRKNNDLTNDHYTNDYRINPGDILLVYVWNEKDLSQEVLVRPDGFISVPLAGQVKAGGLSIADTEKNLTTALEKFIQDKPSVTIAIKETRGYSVFVLGKVNRPGQYPLNQPTDVVQALAMAGGLNAYAAENSINVLHREKDGRQKAVRFRYGDLKNGDNLQSNILLESGDVIIVP